jgi:hypothetical protein
VTIHRRDQEPTACVLSILANGRFREIGRLRGSDEPWRREGLDVSAILAEEGAAAPPFDAARTKAREAEAAP